MSTGRPAGCGCARTTSAATGGRPRAGAARARPRSPTASLARLERHHQRSAYSGEGELVFAHPQTGEPLDHSALVRRYKKALRSARVRQVRFNDLRHTFGTRMAAAGVPLQTLQEWMGHRDFKTTMIYADYAPSAHEREMVESAFRPAGSAPVEAEPTGRT